MVLAGVSLLLAGCGYDATPVPDVGDDESVEVGTISSDCDMAEIVRSYAPGGVTAAQAREQLINDGRLVVGVSADSQLLGARNPRTGDIEGFDIDLAQRIADELGVRVELRVITAGERIDLLREEQIDLVVRNMTITCDRWEEIAFSAEYYHSGQKVMVREDLVDDYAGPESLARRRVCAPEETTSLARIAQAAPDAELVPATNHTGCLLAFQQGRVDAITGDDTVLAGLANQDPYAVVPPGQEPFSDEPYGVGANQGDVALLRFVNGVLEEMRQDGSWQRNYDKWLRPTLSDGSQPTPKYGLG